MLLGTIKTISSMDIGDVIDIGQYQVTCDKGNSELSCFECDFIDYSFCHKIDCAWKKYKVRTTKNQDKIRVKNNEKEVHTMDLRDKKIEYMLLYFNILKQEAKIKVLEDTPNQEYYAKEVAILKVKLWTLIESIPRMDKEEFKVEVAKLINLKILDILSSISK